MGSSSSLQFQSCNSLLKVADLKNLRVTFQEPQDRLGFQRRHVSPVPTAVKTAVLAFAASAALAIFGRAKETGRSLRGGRILSRQSRRATESPSFARSIAFRVSTSASPSSSASTASVVLLRAPRGLPLGFPLWPLRKRAPCFVSVFSSILAPNCQPIETHACLS